MANSIEEIDKLVDESIERSPQDKGWRWRPDITFYDNGLINTGGTPLGNKFEDNFAEFNLQLMQMSDRIRTKIKPDRLPKPTLKLVEEQPIKQTACRSCGAVHQFSPTDTKEGIDDGEAYRYIKCLNCEAVIKC